MSTAAYVTLTLGAFPPWDWLASSLWARQWLLFSCLYFVYPQKADFELPCHHLKPRPSSIQMGGSAFPLTYARNFSVSHMLWINWSPLQGSQKLVWDSVLSLLFKLALKTLGGSGDKGWRSSGGYKFWASSLLAARCGIHSPFKHPWILVQVVILLCNLM